MKRATGDIAHRVKHIARLDIPGGGQVTVKDGTAIGTDEEHPHPAGQPPEPGPGLIAPQSNDVDVDERGLVYVLDRDHGHDILEFQGP